MLVHADVKGLEIVAAGYLSQDPILMSEIVDQFDFHADNQARFKLPNRTVAKQFVFKLLYGGTAYGYTVDAKFNWISRKESFWQDMIDSYYDKYKGIAAWHKQIIATVTETSQLVMPTGRVYQFQRYPAYGGGMKWPITQIKNYPVQGLGADLVAIGRVALWKRVKKAMWAPVLFQSTVHDSIDLDTTPELCYNICKLAKESIEDIPLNFERLFGVKFNLPVTAEIKYGNNLGEMTVYE